MPVDGARFENVVRETESVIRAYLAGLGVGSESVDDIAQDVYVAFYRSMDRLPAEVIEIRWLKGIARNLAMNHFRTAKREQARHQAAVADLLAGVEAPAPHERALSTESILRLCLEKLPERSRRLVRLRYEEGETAERIAERECSQPTAIRVALLRIRQALRDCVKTQAAEGASA